MKPFLPCGSSSILAVTIKEVECPILFYCVNHFELMHDARVLTQNKNCDKFTVQRMIYIIYIYIYIIWKIYSRVVYVGLAQARPNKSPLRRQTRTVNDSPHVSSQLTLRKGSSTMGVATDSSRARRIFSRRHRPQP